MATAEPTAPTISVVIPTRGRPTLVTRAVASVLGQTRRDLEVIVVVDGPDPATTAALEAVTDPRLRVLANPATLGAGAARNAGIAAAAAPWVAFLDDDDAWLPAKLERQVAALEAAVARGVTDPIGFCPIIVRTAAGDTAWRDRAPGPTEPIGDYLFVRPSLRVGEGTVGTSTIIAATDLLRRIPFDPAVRRYQDADWLLRAAAAGARLVHVPERLSIWTAPSDGDSITARHATDWRHALVWIHDRRALVTRRAYAAFVLVRVAALARAAGEPSAIPILWRAAWRDGRPTWREVVLFAARWLVPTGLRRGVRSRLAGTPPSSPAATDAATTQAGTTRTLEP